MIRALLMDLDGTLYEQRPLRSIMARELILSSLARTPGRTLRLFKGLKHFRRVREELRDLGRPEAPLEDTQYTLPAERFGLDASLLRADVEEWMHRRPLRHLGPRRHAGLVEFLECARDAGLSLGVFSDYPVRAKLEALGLARFFSVQLGATDPEINAFKPHPQGFLFGAESLGVSPAEVLFVGDRRDVDGGGADAAGMPCLIYGEGGAQGFASYTELTSAFDARVLGATA